MPKAACIGHMIQWTYSVLRNDFGELAELQSVGRDITDRKQAEEMREVALGQLQYLYNASKNMSTARGLDDILAAVVGSVVAVKLNRAILVEN